MEFASFKPVESASNTSRAVDFWSVQDGLCRWPLVHQPIGDYRACGIPVAYDGAVYCEAHCQMAYRAPEVRKRAA
jgi:hypothetical protein